MADLLENIMQGMDAMNQLHRPVIDHDQQRSSDEVLPEDSVQMYSNAPPVHTGHYYTSSTVDDEQAERRLRELVEQEEADEVIEQSGVAPTPVYRHATSTPSLSSGYSASKPRSSAAYPTASYQTEAEAIRHLIVMQKMTEKGFNLDPEMFRKNPLLALQFVTQHQPHSFCPKPEQHTCSGGTDAHWKLASLKKLKTQIGAKNLRGGVSEWTEDWEKHSRANQEGCSFSQLQAEAPFYHLTDQKTYLATGDVFVCVLSGNSHVCTSELCRNQITLPREEGIECSLTHRHYGVPMVYVEERDRTGEGRDGGMTYTSVKSSGVQMRSKKKSQKNNAAGGSGSTVSAMEERLNSMHTELSVLKRVPGHEHNYLYEYFTSAYPRVKYPVPSAAGVSLTDELCNVLVYDSEVRKSVWDKLKSTESEAQTLIKQHYLERLEKGKYRNQCHVVDLLMRIKPYWDRLATIGFFDEDPDQRLLVYLHDCILTVWTLLHYMPFAQRSATGLQLSPRQIVAILYKLQSGFYVSVTYDPVTRVVIPTNSRVMVAGTGAAARPPSTSLVKTSAGQEQQQPSPAKPALGDLSVEGGDEDSEQGATDLNLDFLDSMINDDDDLFGDLATNLAGVDPDQKTAPVAGPVTKLICFIPRHRFLQCVPQKADLNRFARFKKYSLDSNTVIKTDKMISDCYESLMNQKGVTVDRLLEFALERYINLRDFP